MQTERASASAKVLLVDDEAYNRALLRAHFEPSGYTCIEASSGTQALALAASERPDLVLLDVLIPEMDGDTVLAELKLASAR
ncbi:MAG: response regulator, partial [Polyangia bacterium]